MNAAVNDTTIFMPIVQSGNEVCRIDDMPVDTVEIVVPRMSYADGIEALPRAVIAGNDSGVMTLMLLTLLLVAFSFRRGARLFKSFTQDLWSLRRRENAFDEHTANETRTLVLLLFQTCVYQGVLLYAHINNVHAFESKTVFPVVSCMIGISLVFYLLQLTAYSLVGYVFTDKIGASQWIKGFNASQLLLGFAIMIPAFVSIFYPGAASAMCKIALTLYFIARVIFICKGFRIFYHNFGSLLYFILYLCTLEIIPVILVYSGAWLLVDFLL